MDKVIAVRKHLNYEQWKTIITECRYCDMTTTAGVRQMASVNIKFRQKTYDLEIWTT